MKFLNAFGAFWWDFFIADTPEIFIGCLLILGLTFLVRGSPVGGAIALPAAVIALLIYSSRRGRKR